MIDKKEAELQKYLEKKNKQKKRDEIMQQIANLTNKKDVKAYEVIKNKIRKKNKDLNKIKIDISNSTEETMIIADVNINEAKDILEEGDMNIRLNKPAEIAVVETEMMSELIIDNRKTELIDLNEMYTILKCIERDAKIQMSREKLDIFYEETEIVNTIKYNLITFIHGSTGCGKTTQIPQFLYENGFSTNGLIGITQPRRFSAISIANRISTELNNPVCGYKIKYENNITEKTCIKVVTEGVLVKEIQSDFLLLKYSVIILDEVHERSINCDILIGLLSRIVMKRIEMKNPLRLILMSATANTACYKNILGDYKTITLKSKPFQTSIFYEDKTPDDYLDAIYEKIKALVQQENCQKKSAKKQWQDKNMPDKLLNTHTAAILVFLPGKEEIFDLMSRFTTCKADVTVLPLYSGQSKYEQSKVYETYSNRKIILATNIAETSITIDDIVFVIDSGKVKKKLMDSNIVLYKIDFISKSSAIQRTGRCGRTGPGVCYRMYSTDLYQKMNEYDIPQILSEPFDATMLQLKAMGIFNIFGFPFIDQPTESAIKDAISTLQISKALDQKGNITKEGKVMCQYPITPKLSRLLLLSMNEQTSVFSKILVIISLMSCNFELKRTNDTESYFISAKSDLIVGLRIFIDYHTRAQLNKNYRNECMSKETYFEVIKMTKYMIVISQKGTIEEAVTTTSYEDEKIICKLLFYAFANQYAINNGSSYFCNGGDIFVSKNSIDTNNMNFVFNYIICGRNKSYGTGITLIESEWLK